MTWCHNVWCDITFCSRHNWLRVTMLKVWLIELIFSHKYFTKNKACNLVTCNDKFVHVSLAGCTGFYKVNVCVHPQPRCMQAHSAHKTLYTHYWHLAHQTWHLVVLKKINPSLVLAFSSLFISLSRITEPKRPLKPVRKERKKATAQAVSGREVNILINIIRASYIPIRKTKG